MKYSGVEWIGEIPDSWEVRKVKHCFYISKEQANEANPTVLSLARTGVKIRNISDNKGQLAASYDNYNPVQPGDLLLNPMDLYSGANCSLSEVSGVISPAYINLRKQVDLNPKFFDYYFKTQYWARAMFAHGKGVSFDNRWTMNAETVLNYYLPFPTYEKQNKIVEKINHKAKEIDFIMEIENQQIDKLKEYKRQFILEKICKGLNNSELVDSNIDWIGKIPSTWRLTKIKYVTEVSRGLFNHRPRNDIRLYNGGYPFIQTGDVARANKYIYDFSQTLNELGANVSKEFKKGTLTMTIAANVGDVSILNFDAYFPDSIVGFTPINNYLSEYLYYIFYAMKLEFIRASIVSTQLNLNIERIRELYIPFTSNIEEQKMLVTYLNKKCEDIDKLIEVKKQKIEQLGEYKKSLIYDYITGKKEVTLC